MTVSNGIKKRNPVYSEKSCDCGVIFRPKTSRQKHCSPECRFRAIADPFKAVSGCWEWPKGYFTQTGYGQFALDADTPETAHRMSYIVFNGDVAQGLFVCHRCDNKACFNPEHLFLGTHQDNMRDMIEKGRANYTKPSGPANAMWGVPNMAARKFSAAEEEVIMLKIKTHSLRAIARSFGCSHSTIRRVLMTTSGSKDKTAMLANSTPTR